MKINEILLEYNNLIPQPSTLRIETSAYEFIQLMKQFRAEQDTQSLGDKGLVTFYTPEEKTEFQNFLTARGIMFQDIGSNI